ncbi:hypothetical protein [Nonomuraea recticatena]
MAVLATLALVALSTPAHAADPAEPAAGEISAAYATAACDSRGTTSADSATATWLNGVLSTKMKGHVNAYRISCARMVVEAVRARGLDRRAADIAIATTIVESSIQNVAEEVDHDSLGLFQQRASWGSAGQRLNPTWATNAFLNAMIRKYPNNTWKSAPIGEVCQTVQVSAYPDRYQVEAGDAQKIVDALWSASTHVVALGVNGEIYHTMRRADGSWQSAGNVEGQAGTLPGAVTGVASAVVSGELHVLATANDEIFHVARRVGGSWSAWGRVEGQAGEVGAPTSIAAASIDGELEILAVAGGVLRHTGRNADGSWSGWGNVEGQAGEIGAPVSIGATGVGGTLHVVAAAAGVVRHVTQRADGSWSSWGNVEGQAGEVGNPTSVAVTATGGVLEILASAEGVLRHAGRHTDGSWSSWGNVEGQAGELGTPVSVGAASAGNGVLHVLAVNSAGTPYHATQSPGGSWSGWGNIDRQADYPVTIQKISGS